METQLAELKQHMAEVVDLGNIGALLGWDQSTYMPQGGGEARGRQIAMMSRMAQQKLTDDRVGVLLDELKSAETDLPYDSDDAAFIRVARRSYERAVKVPTELIAELSQHASNSYMAWAEARPANDFASMQPLLEKTLDLSRQIAECFEYDHVADPLIRMSDEGMSAASVRGLFSNLRSRLVPLVEAIGEQSEIDNSILHRNFPIAQQEKFGKAIIKKYGYDFTRGRQDLTHHPFMTKFSLGDVRITTRFSENDLTDGLFSTLHEAGHAMYEQGIDMKYESSPLANGTSSGVHESQSRLWENIVGRSRGFWRFYYPKLQAEFSDQLGDVSEESFYRAINKVSRSLIRVDADEVTYNLHVMIRFELALQMLEGSLAVRDLPEAWHARYESDLGLCAPSDVDGVLQDVHWYAGTIGGSFQGYTLGNVMSSAFYDKALAAHSDIPQQIERGEFVTLHGWLRDNIYVSGSKYTAPELVERVLGGPLTIDPYINYLNNKFGDLYGLN